MMTNNGPINDTEQGRDEEDEIIMHNITKWKTRIAKYKNPDVLNKQNKIYELSKNIDKTFGTSDTIILFTIWKSHCLENMETENNNLSPPEERTTSNYLFSYAIPCRVVLNVISILVKKHCNGKILDVGCGTGYWAHLFIECGLQVTAVDDEREGLKAGSFFMENDFSKNYKMEITHYTQQHPEWQQSALFLCWSRPTAEMEQVLSEYDGSLIIFIGLVDEGTLNVPKLMKSRKEWSQLQNEKLKLPSWPGVDDKIYIWTK